MVCVPDDLVPSWEVHFRGMEREWSEVSARRSTALLANWHGDISRMRRQHDRLVVGGLWVTGPSDFLDIVGLARHENTHSRMLKWLLNPSSRHGLGCALVRRLVEHCTGKPTAERLAVKGVTFSQWRNGREADLVVWGEAFTLVIENKIDAEEKPNQCDDLYKNFKKEYKPLFLFLTPEGRKPCTATARPALRAFKTLSWPDIREMIEKEDTHLTASARPPEAEIVDQCCRCRPTP